jgi:hypothetical protein
MFIATLLAPFLWRGQLLFCCLFPFSLIAQVPGYQGKRLLVEAAGTFQMPSNFYKIAFKDYTQHVQFIPRLSLEAVVARKQSLSLSIEKTTHTFSTEYQPFVEGDPFQGDGSLTQKEYRTHVLDIGGAYRFFMPSAWCLAPLGKYFSIGLHYFKAQNDLNFQSTHFMPTLGFGRRHIAFNHFSIHYGAQLGRTLGAWKKAPIPENFEFNLEQYDQGIYKYQLDKTLSSSYFLRIFLAIGGIF